MRFPADFGSSWAARIKTATTPCCASLLRAKARAALLIGAAAAKIAKQLGDSVPIVQCGTLAAAVDRASHSADPGDTVLLAPACASFDQFDNFEHRGRVFKDLVNALAKETR